MARNFANPGLVALSEHVKATARDRRSRPRAPICLAIRRLAKRARETRNRKRAVLQDTDHAKRKRTAAARAGPSLTGPLRRSDAAR